MKNFTNGKKHLYIFFSRFKYNSINSTCYNHYGEIICIFGNFTNG